MAQDKKSLEMRVAELEDKLSNMSLTEEEMQGVQKVMGQAQAIPGPSNCVVQQCIIQHCIIQHCIIQHCIIPRFQCIRFQCFECSCGPCLASGGGGTGTGGFGGLG